MPLFAFANAGVSLESGVEISLNSVMVGTILGLVVGKPIGVVLFCFLGERLNLAVRPKDLNYGHIVAVGMMSGIGFTMSMFVANLAYKDDMMSIDMSKISILVASSIAAVFGLIAVYLSTIEKQNLAEATSKDDEIQRLKDTQSVI